jgi:hypothetical protein
MSNRIVWTVLLSGALLGCSPAGPDCADPLGRGPAYFLSVRCRGEADSVRCTADRSLSLPSYGCAVGLGDVTASARWTSSDETVAVFTSPGFLKTLAPGNVVITVQSLDGTERVGYAVAPGVKPERLIQFSIRARTPAGMAVSGVAVQVIPERGPAGHCSTDAFGLCQAFAPRSFTRIVGLKDGYAPAEISHGPAAPLDLYFATASLTMIPAGG